MSKLFSIAFIRSLSRAAAAPVTTPAPVVLTDKQVAHVSGGASFIPKTNW